MLPWNVRVLLHRVSFRHSVGCVGALEVASFLESADNLNTSPVHTRRRPRGVAWDGVPILMVEYIIRNIKDF